MAERLSLSSNPEWLGDQIEMMDDGNERTHMQELCDSGRFHFTYDGMYDTKPARAMISPSSLQGHSLVLSFGVMRGIFIVQEPRWRI